jgi:hypothetical protein
LHGFGTQSGSKNNGGRTTPSAAHPLLLPTSINDFSEGSIFSVRNMHGNRHQASDCDRSERK